MALYIISCSVMRHIPGYEPEYSTLMKTICMSQPETFVEAEEFFISEFPGSDKEQQGWVMKGDPVICPFYREDVQKWDKYIDEKPAISKKGKENRVHLTVIK